MFKLPGLTLLLSLSSVYGAEARLNNLESIYDAWNQEHHGALQLSSTVDPEIALIQKQVRGRTYWDTVDPRFSEEDIQNFVTLDWRSRGSTFLDHKQALYQRYHFNRQTLRYEFPFAVLSGWWGLNHPPVKTLAGPLGDYHPHYQRPRPDGRAFYVPEFQAELDALTASELTFGNELELLTNTISFQRKLQLIASAKERIWITVMTFSCDESSSQLLDALVAKKRAGVDVKLMVEGLWTKLILNKCLKLMRERGLEVMTLFESIKPATITHLTHSKFWIFDHHRAILGGQNIMDSENLGNGFNEGARDTEVMITGPIATDLSLTFARIWEKNRKKKEATLAADLLRYTQRRDEERVRGLRGVTHYASVLTDPTRRARGVCRVLSQDPGKENSTITRALAAYLRRSTDYVYMTSPKIGYKAHKAFDAYPAGAIFEEILAAAKRQVRVDFVANGIDSLGGDATIVTRRWARLARENGNVASENLARYFSDVIAKVYMQKKQILASHHLATLDPNLNVWNYFRFAHQKVHFFDRHLVGIGSFNLDKHSARGNRETELFCLDDALAAQVDRMVVLDLANSVPL